MTNTAQRAILAEAEESFDRCILTTAIGRLDELTILVCRKCYLMGYLNGGDYVLREGGCYEG